MSTSHRGAAKAVLFLLFLAGAIWLFRATDLREWLTPARIEALVRESGPWGPLIFILAYAFGICLFLPATLFTGIGAVLFGTFYGFLYNEVGSLAGAAMAFYIGRYLGRDFAASLIGSRLRMYDDRIAANGFRTTLYLRLLFFPFTALNFGMGLTRVTFRDYFFGTFFGTLAGGFVLTFFFATLAAVWKSGDWHQLLNWQTVLSVALFVASFFIPKVVRKFQPNAVSGR